MEALRHNLVDLDTKLEHFKCSFNFNSRLERGKKKDAMMGDVIPSLKNILPTVDLCQIFVSL